MSGPHKISSKSGGKFDFKDGGTYIGEWCDGRAHGYGIATGPNNQGEYSGDWSVGFENCGVYIWPSGNVYEGLWMKGKRHGEGIQIMGRWLYKGCFTTGFFGRYGVKSSLYSQSRYEGCWHLNDFDGYGIETCSDGSSYSGLWSKSQRKGLGVSRSAQFSQANDFRDVRDSRPSTSEIMTHCGDCGGSSNSLCKDILVNEIRNGFVLSYQKHSLVRHQNFIEEKFKTKKLKSEKSEQSSKTTDHSNAFTISRRFIMRLKQHKVIDRCSRSLSRKRSVEDDSTESSKQTTELSKLSTYHLVNNSFDPPMSSTSSTGGVGSNSFSSVIPCDSMFSSIPKDAIESYAGQWDGNLRSGLGVAERSDGLKYIGQWSDNRRYGYGVTCFPDNSTEEGRYKDNVLIQPLNRKSRMLLVKNSRLKNLVDNVVQNALDVAQDAKIKAAEIAYQRAQTARAAAISAQSRAEDARKMSKRARDIAKEITPDFEQPGFIWELKRHKNQAASRSAIALAKFNIQSPISSLSFDSGSKMFDACDQTVHSQKTTQKLYKPNQTPTRSRRFQTMHKSKSIANETDFSSEGEVQNPPLQQASSDISRRPYSKWFVGSQESSCLDVIWSTNKKCSPIDQSPPSLKFMDKYSKSEYSDPSELTIHRSKPKLRSFRDQARIAPTDAHASSKSSHQDSGYHSIEPDGTHLSLTSTSGNLPLYSLSFSTSQGKESKKLSEPNKSPMKPSNSDHYDQYSLTSCHVSSNKRKLSLLTLNRGNSMDENILINRNLSKVQRHLSHDNSFESEISEQSCNLDRNKCASPHVSKNESLNDYRYSDTDCRDGNESDQEMREMFRSNQMSIKRRNFTLARSPPAFNHDDDSDINITHNPLCLSNLDEEPKFIPKISHFNFASTKSMSSTNVLRPRSKIPIRKCSFVSPLREQKISATYSDTMYRKLLHSTESVQQKIGTQLTIYDLLSVFLSAWTHYWMLKFRLTVISSLVHPCKVWFQDNCSICIVVVINIILAMVFLYFFSNTSSKEE